VDIGGGASLLIDRLLARGFTDVTLVDISAAALDYVSARLGGEQQKALIRLERADIREWLPTRPYFIWHDRAVFHFVTNDAYVFAYISKVREFVLPGICRLWYICGGWPNYVLGPPFAPIHN